jgi:dTDP-4-dehydrorhamnose 3,5-epimerase-like enzyme
MAHIIHLKTFSDTRGNLTVIEKEIPFAIKRIFYIYGVDDSVRGGHRHHTTVQAAICIHGSCIVSNDNNKVQEDFVLDHPEKCLILQPEDYHTMHHFSPDAVLLVLASTVFNADDYIFAPYNKQ